MWSMKQIFCRHNWLRHGSIPVVRKGTLKHLSFYKCDKCGVTKSEKEAGY